MNSIKAGKILCIAILMSVSGCKRSQLIGDNEFRSCNNYFCSNYTIFKFEEKFATIKNFEDNRLVWVSKMNNTTDKYSSVVNIDFNNAMNEGISLYFDSSNTSYASFTRGKISVTLLFEEEYQKIAWHNPNKFCLNQPDIFIEVTQGKNEETPCNHHDKKTFEKCIKLSGRLRSNLERVRYFKEAEELLEYDRQNCVH